MPIAPLPCSISLPIIGRVHSPLKQKFGTPRQPNLVDIAATIEMLPPFNDSQAFEGIEQFSHLWIVWQFHQNRVNTSNKQPFRAAVRPPRLGGNQKIGVFATRSMYRPANIGLSVVRLSHVEATPSGIFLHIIGADMIEGTPVIDIKPYIAYSDCITQAHSGFASQQPMLKPVSWDADALLQRDAMLSNNSLNQEDCLLIAQLIAQDPRPAYRQTETMTKFFMRYKSLDIGFFQRLDQVMVITALQVAKDYDH
mgnify:FL=1|jgi:tRNA-Thr(GGU) m(6)t(6)A37 methyltransferase TsaA